MGKLPPHLEMLLNGDSLTNEQMKALQKDAAKRASADAAAEAARVRAEAEKAAAAAKKEEDDSKPTVWGYLFGSPRAEGKKKKKKKKKQENPTRDQDQDEHFEEHQHDEEDPNMPAEVGIKVEDVKAAHPQLA